MPIIWYTTYNIILPQIHHSRKDELLSGTIETNPSENSNWRRHKNACPFYRERWFPGNDVAAGDAAGVSLASIPRDLVSGYQLCDLTTCLLHLQSNSSKVPTDLGSNDEDKVTCFCKLDDSVLRFKDDVKDFTIVYLSCEISNRAKDSC